MKFCKPFWSKHKWIRYGDLVEQLFVGGFYAWQMCEKCKKIKFDSCDKNALAEKNIAEKKEYIKIILDKPQVYEYER